MPVAPTYPGVYIEEIPSGVRTIVGVATSITAFIGRAARGPADESTTINNFGDFERIFGGLWLDNRFDTKPIFTLVLLFAGVPISVLVMIVVARRTLARLKDEAEKDTDISS